MVCARHVVLLSLVSVNIRLPNQNRPYGRFYFIVRKQGAPDKGLPRRLRRHHFNTPTEITFPRDPTKENLGRARTELVPLLWRGARGAGWSFVIIYNQPQRMAGIIFLHKYLDVVIFCTIYVL